MKKTRKPGGGRKKLKPEYDAGKNLKEQMESAVALYDSEMSLQAIGDELGLNSIKVRKLLITAGVYESEVAKKVKNTFEEWPRGLDGMDRLVDDYIGDKIPLWEKIMDRQGTVCCAWEKTAFEEELKVGIRLMMEAYSL